MSEGVVYIYNGVDEVPEDVTHVRVDPSVTIIPAEAFKNRRQLEVVKFPEGLIRCGYLEVQFSPNGLQLVLSDEGGRVTVLDTPSTNVGSLDDKLTSWSLSTPTWMKKGVYWSYQS